MSEAAKRGRSFGHGVRVVRVRGVQYSNYGEADKWRVLVSGHEVYESVYHEKAEARAREEAAERKRRGSKR